MLFGTGLGSEARKHCPAAPTRFGAIGVRAPGDPTDTRLPGVESRKEGRASHVQLQASVRFGFSGLILRSHDGAV